VRRPAAVLIDGKLEATPLRQLNQFPAVVEILDERFLRQHVLIGVQRTPHEIKANIRMGGEVENTDVWIAQHGIEIVGDARVREMGVAPRSGALEIARADGDHAQAIARIGVEMRAADAACANKRNRGAAVARHRRTIRQVRRFDLGSGLGHKSIVVGRRSLGFHFLRRGHGSRASVRPSRAESAAVSTMR
jgi:hypothetical protein